MGQFTDETEIVDTICLNCIQIESKHVEGRCLFQPTVYCKPSVGMIQRLIGNLFARTSVERECDWNTAKVHTVVFVDENILGPSEFLAKVRFNYRYGHRIKANFPLFREDLPGLMFHLLHFEIPKHATISARLEYEWSQDEEL